MEMSSHPLHLGIVGIEKGAFESVVTFISFLAKELCIDYLHLIGMLETIQMYSKK